MGKIFRAQTFPPGPSAIATMMGKFSIAVAFTLVHGKWEPKLAAEKNTCSADIGHCGKAYQACCITYGAQGYPCGCSLTDGSGASKGDCGTCGAAYQICCDGYKADGYPCQCDVLGPMGVQV